MHIAQDENEADQASVAASDRYGLSKLRINSRQRASKARNAISYTREKLENAAVSTMPHTHVHRPAYESPIHVRSNTMDNGPGNRTPQCLTSA
jgi:hypothetical protein